MNYCIIRKTSLLTAILILVVVFQALSLDLSRSEKSEITPLKKCWEYRTEGSNDKTLASDNIIITIATKSGNIQAINAETSANIWTTDLGGGIVSNIVFADTGVFIVSNAITSKDSAPDASILRSLSKKTGITNWTTRLPFSSEIILGIAQGKIITAGREGSITAVDSRNGSINWKALLSGQLTAGPHISGGSITYGTNLKEIVSLEMETGVELFRLSTKFIPTAFAGKFKNNLAAGDERGNLILLNILTGRNAWKFKSGAGISAIFVSGNGLVVSSLDNFIYMISLNNGDVLWKRRLPGRILQGVLVTDNFIFASIYGENSWFLIDAKNGKVIDQMFQTEKNYHNQAPLLVNSSNIVFATPEGIESHSVNGCAVKQSEILHR
jgi:outer membrane protein assembly factor BamB